MTYDEFIKQYNGSRIDYDGCAGVQCVDLARIYSIKVLGADMGPTPTGYAEGYFTHPTAQVKKLFTIIKNTAKLVPKKGDLVVWSSALNGAAGHIALATGQGDTNYFISYDYNWRGVNDGWTKINHNYNCVLGVLRPKDQAKVLGKTTSSATPKTLETTGFKVGDNNTGTYAYKCMLAIARKQGWFNCSISGDGEFGAGTKNATNKLLKAYGYKQTGIAGKKLMEKLKESIKKRC